MAFDCAFSVYGFFGRPACLGYNKSITIVQIVHNKNAVWSFVRLYKFGKKSYLLPNLYLVTYS